MTRSQAWLAPGLALTTFATLLVEILSTRLLSVLTWYHLSFLAVSLAMLGMASGAVFVFLRGDEARGDRALRLLGRATFAMAIAIPVVHLVHAGHPHPAAHRGATLAHPPARSLDCSAGRPVFPVGCRRHDRADAAGRADWPALRLGSGRCGSRVPVV